MSGAHVKPAWELATFRAGDGLEHYLHIMEQSNGSNRMFFHCSKPVPYRDRHDLRELPPGLMLRDDACVTCFWCLCDQQRD
jgi:hypothetical protein